MGFFLSHFQGLPELRARARSAYVLFVFVSRRGSFPHRCTSNANKETMNSFLHKSGQCFCAKYAALFLGALPIAANAAVITFGTTFGFGMAPYSEAGFVTSTNSVANAILSPNGNFASYFFSFQGPESEATVYSADSAPFDLVSLDIGLGGFSDDSFADITINASVFGGGTYTTTYSNVTSVQNVTLNWANITSFTVSGTDDPGIDNINVSPSAVPEPGSAATALVLASGLIGLVSRRRRC